MISQKHTPKFGVWHVACGTENVRGVRGQVQSGVGDSERLLASLFRKAAAAAPCVLFLDELQAPPYTILVSALFFWEIILLDRF